MLRGVVMVRGGFLAHKKEEGVGIVGVPVPVGGSSDR